MPDPTPAPAALTPGEALARRFAGPDQLVKYALAAALLHQAEAGGDLDGEFAAWRAEFLAADPGPSEPPETQP